MEQTITEYILNSEESYQYGFLALTFLTSSLVMYLNEHIAIETIKALVDTYKVSLKIPYIQNKNERNILFVKPLENLLKSVNVNKLILGNLNINKPKIYIANHQSYLDPIIIKTLNPNIYTIAKSDAKSEGLGSFFNYIIHPIMDAWNIIYYKRGDKKNGSQVREEMAKAIHRKKSILVFPEGSAYTYGGIRDFFPGSFEVAFENNITIQPITIKYKTDITWGVKEEKSKKHNLDILCNIKECQKNKNDVIIKIHEELNPKDFENANHLKEYSKYIMQKEWISHSL